MSARPSGNAAASADPFYVFKDELEGKVTAVHQQYAKWKSVLDAQDSASAKDLPALTTQIETSVAAAEKSLKFLEQTIVVVEANRAKFEHIDNAEISSRKAFVSSTRMELLSVSSELQSDAVKTRIRREEQKMLKPLSQRPTQPTLPKEDSNARFLGDELQRQQQIQKEQDQGLEELSKSAANLNHIAVEINSEIKSQNHMLDEMSTDVDEAHERMNFVMEKMSDLLKTKDKCQLGLILFLSFVLVVMIFLVIYT
ncbi:TPA: hypothetical protein N0F65_002735 [Lagenidium giganteum]|uniref:t-SNARE coiled-coil homology domain-containing protein n=1 Tax=Lagenidium giganteum TaxID=4803 RepID=A0AAV2Z4Y5_9STRA|nr:TPA: hypothetical protein N0F65_002735 [Lagenidium giganteum]